MSVNESVQISNENIDYDVCDYSVADVTSEHQPTVIVNMNTSKTQTKGKQFFLSISCTKLILKLSLFVPFSVITS